jgi:acyl-CoA synthetase (AMP-forming)/AMP-acid ligase II
MSRHNPDPQAVLASLPRRIHDIVFAQAARDAAATALCDETGAWCFGELAEAVRSGAAWLRDSGVRGGDRVLLITENCREAAALLLACSAIDAWAVLVNARLSAPEIEVLQTRSAPRLVCAVLGSVQARKHAAHFALATAAVAGLGRIAVSGTDAQAEAEPVQDSAADQVAVMIYTSGSSGEPKGVMLTHRNLLYMAAISGGIRSLVPTDRLLGVLPISHSVGLSVVLLGALMHGAAVHFLARFTPPAFFKALTQDAVSVVLGAPSMLSLLLEYASERNQAAPDAPSLRILSVSGAPLELPLKNAAEAFFGIPLHHGYGITECGPTIAQIRPGLERADCAVGPLLPGVQARLAGEDGLPAKDGDPGELFVRSPSVMRGYYRDPARTQAVLDPEGWFRTGDLARLDGDELIITGRANDLIIRFGFNVYPGEVEAVLARHEAVLQAAVAGRPGAQGEEILAFIVPRAGYAPDIPELAQHAAEHLTSYKRPTRFFVLHALPLTPTGKIDKRRLLAAAENPAAFVKAA